MNNLGDGDNLLGDGDDLLGGSGDLLGDGGNLLGDVGHLLGDSGNLLGDGEQISEQIGVKIGEKKSVTYLPTYLHLTWVGARDACASKNPFLNDGFLV